MEKIKYTKEYFEEMKSLFDHDSIIETGRIYRNYDGLHKSINYSRILTELIQTTGRFCEYFASDLFIDWQTVMEEFDADELEDSMYLFGIRQNGVDHLPWVINRYNNRTENEYRAVYRLKVEYQYEEGYGYEVTMTLDRIK